MARKRKKGPRTKSGRLSRAYKTVARDEGTPQAQAKRAALINGADPQLGATASGILLANGLLSLEQHHAALTYSRLHALIFDRPWPHACPLSRELAWHGTAPPESMLLRAERRLSGMNARLDPDQRRQVANVAVFGMVPAWFFAARGIGRALGSDERDKSALLSGLDALAADGPGRAP